MGVEGEVGGFVGEVMLWPKGGAGKSRAPAEKVVSLGHFVDRLVGSDAVGGGGGPRRSRSSM